jgi:hypothetical protein
MTRSILTQASAYLAAICAALLAPAAQADLLFFEASSGPALYRDYRGVSLTPNTGDWQNRATALVAQTALAGRLHLGAEFGRGEYQAALPALPAIDVRTYELHATLRLVAFPGSISPYAGLSFGVDATRFNGAAIESTWSSLGVDSFGIAVAGIGFVGLELPLTDRLALFGEGRAGVAYDLANNSALTLGARPLQGIGGAAGLRMSF